MRSSVISSESVFSFLNLCSESGYRLFDRDYATVTTWHDMLREKRQETILEAAAQIIARKGYQRATMKEIADAAGIAPGTIYLYFSDKEDLLLSIAEQLVALMPQEVPRAATPAETRRFVQSVLRQQLGLVAEYRPFFEAITAEMWTNETLRTNYLGRVITPILGIIESFLHKGIEAGRVRSLDPQIVSRAMVGTIFLFAMISDTSAEDYLRSPRVEQLIEELTDFFLYGLKQTPDTEVSPA